MTNKEILQTIKELRDCASGEAEDCPFTAVAGCDGCPKVSADLIERLTAENAELRKEIEWKDMVISLAQREQAKALDAADIIDRLTDENAALREKVPQWISVEERRPEPGKRVLATDGVFVGEAYRTSANTWRRYDGMAMRDCIGSVVTHWMQLPGAPEEGDKHE